jgi:hypothetical protein
MRYTAYDPKTGATFFPKVYPNFPYAQRFCRFCERELDVINALHNQDHPEIYKCIMICENPDCEAFDEEARKAYIRVYYSSEEALVLFESVFLRYQRIEK